MNVLIAPNAFKGNLSALEVAQILASEIANPGISTKIFPIADGGDGTLEVFLEVFSGERKTFKVLNPAGREVVADWGMLDEITAIIEISNASGIKLLDEQELNPLTTSTYGTGQLLVHAIENGAKKVLLGIGGSATVDGGIGMLSALGAVFYGGDGKVLPSMKTISNFSDVNLSACIELLKDVSITILSDVDNPLLGENGAANVFGPQKGATNNMVVELEERLKNWSQLLISKTGKDQTLMKGAGAAGGLGYALASVTNAKMVNGFNYLLENSQLKLLINECDVIITGEGKIDEQTISGKGPGEIIHVAKEQGKVCIVICGIAADSVLNESIFDKVFTLVKPGVTKDFALKNSRDLLTKTAGEIVEFLLSNFQQTDH